LSSHYALAEMTWPEFQAAAAHVDTALVPLGATEQHGPGGTFSVDTARTEAFVRHLAQRLHPTAIALPVFPYAVSMDHMCFPGTITLSSATMTRVVEQIAVSLSHHGIKKIFFITGHAKTGPVLNNAIANLKNRLPALKTGWVYMSSLVPDLRAAHVDGPGGHADEAEISECLYLAPDTVRTDSLLPGDPVESLPPLAAIRLARPFSKVSRNGALGNPFSATRQLGEQLVRTSLERLETYLREHF
jgi:creatinine amidohydrolase